MSHRRIVWVALLVFVLSLAIGVGFIQALEQRRLSEQQRTLGQVAAFHAHGLQQQLSRSFSATLALASLLRQFKRIENFEAIAADMLESYGGLSALQLAPGGEVAQAYPPESATLAQAVLDASPWDEADRQASPGEMKVSAPIELHGELEIAGQLPVFLPDDLGRERFWGVAMAWVKLSELVALSTLGGLAAQGYDFALAYQDEQGESIVFAGDDALAPSGSSPHTFEVPGGTWLLWVLPIGHGSDTLALGVEVALVLLVSGLLGVLGYGLLRQPLILRREVAARTQALSEANRRLQAEVLERQEAQAALMRSEERFRDLFENANDAIYTLDLQGRFTSFNRQAERLSGLPQGAALGRRADTLVRRQDRPAARRAFIQNLRGRRQTFELALQAEAGKLVVEINARPIERDGRRVGVQGIARDVTERRMLEQMKDEFVATVSHELRTPLTSIKGYSELLRRSEPGALSEQQRQFLDILMRNAQRLTSLIDDLLDIASLDAGRGAFSYTVLDLNGVLQDALETFRVRAQEKGLGLRGEWRGAAWVRGDPGRLHQVFANLLSNAIKYTPRDRAEREPSGEVCVRSFVRGEEVVVEVADNGIGIAPEDLGHMFDKFFRAPDVYQRQIGGTGLGLAISKSIIEHHRGRIEVTSELGCGTTFAVHLPAVQPVAARPAGPFPARGAKQGG